MSGRRASPSKRRLRAAALLAAGAFATLGSFACNLYEGRTLQLFRDVEAPSGECGVPSDCPPDRSFCTGGSCVECLSDSDCGPAKPACFGNVCVECRTASHCAANQTCNPVLSTCSLECGEPSDCAGQAASLCSGELDLCVQCLSDTDCTEPRNPACDRGGLCVECLQDANCPPDRPSCNLDTRACVQCVDSSQCDGRVCDPRDSRCVDCLADADCGAGTCEIERRRCRLPCTGTDDCEPRKPICDPSGLCIACNEDANCTDPKKAACNEEHECVECLQNEHCEEPAKPACITANQRCGECTSDAHCPATGHCDLAAARCAPAPPLQPDGGPGPGPGPAPPAPDANTSGRP